MIIYEDGTVKSTFHCTTDYNGRNFQNRRVASLSNILLNIIYTKGGGIIICGTNQKFDKLDIMSILIEQERAPDFHTPYQSIPKDR